ncbi:MAG TPA: methyltransferase domain-containing protein [Candidatus Binatia bacterium]|nr:methyltransferase domain-containing protein [Candidatus Binatia bacterium]
MKAVVGKNFFDEWSVYDQVLDNNYMHHDEIFRDVGRFLAERFDDRPFTLLDLGCGSARHLARALKGRSISRYIGYDLSDVALAHATRNLNGLGCPVELHQGELLQGLRASGEEFDVIFTSFALHHLATAEKEMFFQSAYERLRNDGILLLVDTMREEGEERPVYLDRYCAWLRFRCKTLAPATLDLLCDHIRGNDFPETAATLSAMATRAGFGRGEEISRIGWHRTLCFARAAPGVRIT